jgi:HEAT repeat protein
VAEFILSFVQALLRTGYYLPDHPEARRAKQGLFSRFQGVLHERHELTVMHQALGDSSEILVEGALAEPQPLHALMAAGMAEVYVPRLARFLERKDLVSLTLKESMGEQEFSRFIDILSEPSAAVLDAQGKERFVAHLRENGIEHFSLVFKEDLVSPERKLPWRAQLAISRLRKDFKNVPIFQNLGAAEFRRLRQQSLHEVLRPISRADLLAAILTNSDLAASPEVPESEVEDELAQFVPDALVVPTARAALATLLAAEGPRWRDEKRALLKLVLRLRPSELPGLAELTRDLFDRDLVALEQLPLALQAQVNLEREADRFLAQRPALLKRFEATSASVAYRQQADTLLRLIPELLRRNLLDEVLGLVTLLRGHAALSGARGGVAEEALARLTTGDVAATLKQKFLTGKKEERVVLATAYQALGAAVRPQLVAILREARDAWVRKNAAEVLLRMGPEAGELLVGELSGGQLPPAARPELVMVLGELRCEAPSLVPVLHRLARDPDSRVREEAAWTLCRLRGAAEQSLFLELVEDPDLEVRRRAIRCLRTARCGGGLEKVIELLSRLEHEPALAPLEPALYAALPDLAEAAPARGGRAEAFLVDRLRQSLGHGLLAALQRPKRALDEAGVHAICDALGALGTRASYDALAELARHAKASVRERLVQALQRIAAAGR